MSEVFGEGYAIAYDSFYRDKDYRAEVDLLERCFARYGDGAVQSIVDLGCGTGNHALELAARGYRLTGVDRSEAMLDRARHKARERRLAVTFTHADLRQIELENRFDAATMWFAVLGYLTANHEILSVLQAIRRHLRPGGLLVFDVWYGPAVLTVGPSPRILELSCAPRRVIRLAQPEPDVRNHACIVSYRLLELDGERLVRDTTEQHRMRYFFPLELEMFLTQSGFELLRLGEFPEIDRDPQPASWNVICVARAV
jgi:SAM-dependent methyltransferase